MKHEIEEYQPKAPEVVAIGDARVRAYVGDAAPTLGSTLWVNDIALRIVSLAGGHRVEALCFDTEPIAVGDPVRCSDESAGWPRARKGVTALTDLRFEPGRASEDRPEGRAAAPMSTGIVVVDTMLPLVRHGVTLLLDSGAPNAPVDRLLDMLEAPLVCASARAVPAASHQVLGSNPLALLVAVHWAIELGANLGIESRPFELDQLLDSTGGLTAVVRMHLRDGLEILAESLDLGHSDTQMILRTDGTIDLARSASRVAPEGTAARFAGLEDARERLQIFGEHDLTAADRELLAQAKSLEAGLLFGDDTVTG